MRPDILLTCVEKLSSFMDLSDEAVDGLVARATSGISVRIKAGLLTNRKAQATKEKAENKGSKFAGKLCGGSLDDFYGGVTGLVGEPRTDLAEGTLKEHLETLDADIEFTTMNYGITTTPKLEYNLVTTHAGPSGDGIQISGTRLCPKKGVAQEDWITLRPIQSYLYTEEVR